MHTQPDHKPTIFICADHGLAVIYFLQSDVMPALLDAGVQVVVLTDDALAEGIRQRFARPGMAVEGLRLKQAAQAHCKKGERAAQAGKNSEPRLRQTV